MNPDEYRSQNAEVRTQSRAQEPDALKERVREELERAGLERRFVTAREILLRVPVESRDPMRVVKKRVEALRDEGCPIVGLPQTPGPGYTWIHDPESEWAQNVIALFEDDMRGRVKRMMVHLATVRRCGVERVQLALFAGRAG